VILSGLRVSLIGVLLRSGAMSGIRRENLLSSMATVTWWLAWVVNSCPFMEALSLPSGHQAFGSMMVGYPHSSNITDFLRASLLRLHGVFLRRAQIRICREQMSI